MPKMKTKSAATKRFKKHSSGKVKRSNAFTSHLFSNKSQKQKRHLRKASLVSASDLKSVSKMI